MTDVEPFGRARRCVDSALTSKRACENKSENIRLDLKGLHRTLTVSTCAWVSREPAAQRSLRSPSDTTGFLRAHATSSLGSRGRGFKSRQPDFCDVAGIVHEVVFDNLTLWVCFGTALT
jgi:hypothetical protein